MSPQLLKNLEESLQFIKTKTSITPKIGITLGSGLSSFAKQIENPVHIPYAHIPHFAPPTVAGHPGQLILGYIKKIPVAVLQGRIHFYEGHNIQDVVYATRLLSFLGIKKLILTNAAGGLNPRSKPGDFMLITDHINLTGQNPLVGKNVDSIGPRFPDMSETYNQSIIKTLEKIMKKKKVRFYKGVYCGVTGPCYETAAEIRYMQKIGGGAVGMSTVAETIAAHHMGVQVCGISCVTNLGTGITKNKITHDEVKEIAKKVEKNFNFILTELVHQIG